jgi:Na+/H+ antiporter NhaA
VAEAPPRQTARTAWVRNLATPLRVFVATEVGSALILLAATVVALLWVNSPWGSTYEQVWDSELSIGLGGAELSHSLREWINDGLMALFFFVIGLEIRREFDLGELRDRRRVAVPVVAAVGGMAVPALLYVSLTSGSEAVHAWGMVMATDTAFALGALALVGRSWPLRIRAFLLTLVVVDDVGALTVIALAYTEHVSVMYLAISVAVFALVFALRAAGIHHGGIYFVLGVALWFSLLHAGVHPTIAGVAMGLLATAYPPTRTDLSTAASLWRSFREQPTYEYARSASRGLRRAISPNERMQDIWHPWTSYVIVPLFALANAGVELSGGLLRNAATSPITIGIILGLVVGKPVGITLASWLTTRRWLGGFPLTIPWPPLLGTATIAGIGFTVSLFIAGIALSGEPLEEAKVGILAASVIATGLSWVVFTAIERLPARRGGTPSAAPLIDLADPVDPSLDHIRGPESAKVTLVEYGDFECPYCGQAEPVVRDLLSRFGTDLRYVFRHLPLDDVHEHAQLAAEASEVAAHFGKFWEMHDRLFRAESLAVDNVLDCAADLGLDREVVADKLRRRSLAARVARDVDSADRSGVTGTPTFFANGRRHHGAYDLASLTALVRTTLSQAKEAAARRDVAAAQSAADDASGDQHDVDGPGGGETRP